MTARKRSGATRTARTLATKDVDEGLARAEPPEGLGSPSRRRGWFGLLLTVAVYFTVSMCAELLIAAFLRLVDEDTE